MTLFSNSCFIGEMLQGVSDWNLRVQGLREEFKPPQCGCIDTILTNSWKGDRDGDTNGPLPWNEVPSSSFAIEVVINEDLYLCSPH